LKGRSTSSFLRFKVVEYVVVGNASLHRPERPLWVSHDLEALKGRSTSSFSRFKVVEYVVVGNASLHRPERPLLVSTGQSPVLTMHP